MMLRTACFSFLVLLAALGFTSCSGVSKHPIELASADSLSKAVEVIDSVFKKIDTAAVHKAYDLLSSNLRYIKFNLEDPTRKDTITRDERLFLTQFFNVKRVLGICTSDGRELLKKIHEEEIQCTSLAHDLRHNTLSEKLDAKTCLLREKQHVTALSNSAGMLAPAVLNAFKTYQEKMEGVLDKVKQLKATGGKEPPVLTGKKRTDDEDDD